MEERIANELEHAKKLTEGGAEVIWNWDRKNVRNPKSSWNINKPKNN